MADKFMNKYRIPSARMKGYDYGKAGFYFVTICTHNRKKYFGKIINNKMQLSNIGVLADIFWHEIKHHTKNVELHEFVVMPDHIHGIIEILDKTDNEINDCQNGNPPPPIIDHYHDNDHDTDVACNVSERDFDRDIDILDISDFISSEKIKNEQMAKISPKSGSLGRIIGSYKGAVTKHARRLGYEFNWQTRFHDIIIWDKLAFYRISKYIENNPRNWGKPKIKKKKY